ncbi:unnamed protein product, partial [Urochloa humidicola]
YKIPTTLQSPACLSVTVAHIIASGSNCGVEEEPPLRSKMKEGTANCLDILIAIILPPLGVFFKFGCKVEFWLCLLLTFLGYLPGIIYAIYAITKE